MRSAGPWLLVSLLWAGCEEQAVREWTPADHQEPSADPDSSQQEPAGDEGAHARAAASLYLASCAGCHGASGRGGGPGLPPGTSVPDLAARELQDTRTDEALARVIREGRGVMPGFGDRLNERGIAALVAHVRTLRAE